MKLTKQQINRLYNFWKSDLLSFTQDFLEHYLTQKIPDFHLDIYKLLRSSKRLALAAPRGFGKSMVVSVFYPLHEALFGLKKDILIISASEGLAIEWVRKIRRELENNPLILKYFGDMRSEKWTENHLLLSNGVNIRARGAGAQIRGFRPDLIVADDIETDESVASEEQRNKMRDWLYKACLNTLMPEGQFVIIGTIISPVSLLQEILDTQASWTKRVFQAYKGGEEKEGSELWPELWPHKRLQARKAEIGSFAFACFTGDTQVYTPNGLKMIKDISVGDVVYNKNLDEVEVKAIGSRTVYHTYKIWLYGYDKPIECSDNHLFLVYEPTFYRNRYYNHQSMHKATTGNGNVVTLETKPLVWKPAGELEGNEFCIFPISKKSDNSYDKEFWWFVGRYLAEGCIVNNCIQICANKKEYHLLKRTTVWLEATRWKGRKGERKIYDCGKIYRIYIGNKELASILKRFGSKGRDKRLTNEAKMLNKDNFMSLLDGYLSGDGYISSGKRMVNSISRQLLLDIKMVLAKFGIPSYLNKIKDYHKSVIGGNVYKCQPLYHLTILDDTSRTPKVYFKDNLQYSRIRKIEISEGVREVFDIKTDGTFLVDGAIVHNSEYLNNPVNSDAAPIKERQIRYWRELPNEYSCVITVDPAYSDDQKADYKVASLIAIDARGNRYLVNYLRTHRPSGEFIDGVLNMYLQWRGKITGVGVPNSGVEKEFFRSFQRKAAERGIYPPIIELKNVFVDGNNISHRRKTSRIIAALQPLFEAGKYYIHESHKEAKDELLMIGASRWDDIVDTLAYAEQIIQPHYAGAEGEKRGRYGEPLEEEKEVLVFDYGY